MQFSGGYRVISTLMQVQQSERCPVRIRNCSITSDSRSRSRYLQLELENHSRHTLSQIHLRISCYDRAGTSLGTQEQIIQARNGSIPKLGVSHYTGSSIVLPNADLSRISVRVKKVVAYRCGDHGETIDITYGDPA